MLKEKVILVTGGAKGIGRSIVEKCINQGALVILDYRSLPDDFFSWKKKIDETRIFAICADITKENDMVHLSDEISNRFGHLDGIVNNAGVITRSNSWNDIDISDWRYTIENNIIGTWNVIRSCERLLIEGSSIVNISSVYSMNPSCTELAYSISKAGINALTLALAKELSPSIRVNAIAPGNTMTEMVPDIKIQKLIESKTLLKRSATPQEIASVVAFLLSNESSYMTGNIIAVDGGFLS